MPHPGLSRPRSPLPVVRAGRKRAGVATLALSMVLNGCTLSPEYHRPEVEVPSAYRYEPKAAAATVNTAWWQQYGDPVLDELIETALANNYTVQIAAANVEQAIGIVTQTRSALYPQLGYGASGEKLRSPDTGLAAAIPNIPNTQETYQALLSASWELDLWGRIRSLSEAAQANMLATEEARRGVILTLVSSVASTYIVLRGLDEQLAISQRTLAAYGESAKLYQLQYKYGQTSLMTVAQTQSQYETAATQIPLIESQIAQVENALSVLLGESGSHRARQTYRSIDRARSPGRAALRAAGKAPGSGAGGAAADRGQCANRRRQGPVLPHHFPDRCLR